MATKLILDNLKLLDCYYQTNYLTEYLDSIESYQPYNRRLILPYPIWSNSLLTNKGYQLAISRPNNNLIHTSLLYLLFYLDKHLLSHRGTLELLRINNNKYNNVLYCIKSNRLRAILRPSKPYIGLKHKGGYPRSRSVL